MSKQYKGSINSLLLAMFIVLPLTVSAQAESQDQADEDETILEEVVVTGMRVSALNMRNAKKNSDNVSDSIFAEDMGKMPDSNIAEAMQRITGVSIDRVDGEGSTVTIRGVDPSLNQVNMNGVPLTNGGDNNAVNFATMSADMLRSIEVVKSPSANHDEGSLGGMVNLKTFRPLSMNQRRITATLQVQQDELADETDPVFNAAYADKFADDRFGLSVSVYYDERTTRQDYSNNYNWKVFGGVTATSAETGESLGKIFSHEPVGFEVGTKLNERIRYGGAATLEFAPDDVSSFWLDLSYSNLDVDSRGHQTRITALRKGNVWDEESGSSFYSSSPKTSGNILSRWAETETETTTLGLGYERDIGEWNLLAKVGLSETEQDWPRNNRLNFKPAAQEASADWINENGNFSVIPTLGWGDMDFWDVEKAYLFQIYDDDRKVKDDYDSVSLDLARAMNAGPVTGISFGAKYFKRSKDRSQTIGNTPFSYDDEGNRVYLSDWSVPFPVDDFFTGVPGDTVDGWPVPDFDAIYGTYLPDGFDGPPNLINTYTTETKATAAYIKADFSTFNDRFVGDFGVRYVKTDVRSIGHQGINFPAVYPPPQEVTFPVDLKNDYTNWLPSFNSRFILNDDMLLRFSVAKVMARPKDGEIRPGVVVKATNPTLPSASGGNPLLDPTEATQFDLSWEWYFGETGLVSVAGFYKDLDSFIFTQTDSVTYDCPDGVPVESCLLLIEVPTTMPINGSGGTIKGIELAYQQQFDFLPGFLSDFGGIINYTYADSDATYVEEGVQNAEYFKNFPFLNTSEDTFNATIYWERAGHTVRLAYNYRSESLFEAIRLNSSIWLDSRESLDFSAVFKLTKRMNLTMAATNLTDEYNRRFVTRTVEEKGLEGEGNALEGGSPDWRTAWLGHNGRTFRIGLNFRF
jgi:TonB-dependent receptor